MFSPSVFLSGPMTGLSFSDIKVWRDKVKRSLEERGITCFSPLRGLDFLQNELELKESYPENAMSTDGAITLQDLWDVMKCDLMMVNLMGAQKVSIGTVFEIAWAYLLRKPILLVMEKEGNCHEHPMIRRSATCRTDNLEEAIFIAKRILLPNP